MAKTSIVRFNQSDHSDSRLEGSGPMGVEHSDININKHNNIDNM